MNFVAIGGCQSCDPLQAVVYTGFRGWGGGPRSNGGVLFDIGESKKENLKFSKNVKKSMKKL